MGRSNRNKFQFLMVQLKARGGVSHSLPTLFQFLMVQLKECILLLEHLEF